MIKNVICLDAISNVGRNKMSCVRGLGKEKI